MGKSKWPNLRTCQPGKLRLVHYDYSVVFGVPDDDPDKWGMIEPGKLLITINPTPPPAYRAGSLLHEIAHDLISPVNDFIPTELEESICDLVGDGLVVIARHNPEFMRHLAETVTSRPRR